MARLRRPLLAAILALLLVAPAVAGELLFPAGVDRVRLPARVVKDRIIVRVVVAGRGLDMLLDTGSSGIVLDRAVAAQLARSGTVDAVYALGSVVDVHRALLPQATIGPLLLRDTDILSTPFSVENDVHTRAVGLLGYDFIAHCVLRIDYADATVDAIRPDAFRPPPAARAVPLQFENDIPLVRVSVNGIEGERFVLDTGADMLTIFPRFAAAHPSAVHDALSRTDASVAKGLHAVGVGGEASQYPTVLEEARFGGERFAQIPSLVVRWMPLRIDGSELDGLVGNALLRRFVVYLDYPHRQVLLESNQP
jgi:predicted aspartyl protease